MAKQQPTAPGTNAGAPTERPAEPGERCPCGRPALVVYLTATFGPVPFCGISDGGQTTTTRPGAA